MSIGPQLPKNWKSETRFTDHDDDALLYGPSLPPDLLESGNKEADDEEPGPSSIGPQLPLSEEQEFEEYRRNITNYEQRSSKQCFDKSKKREEWMTELPEKLKPIGLTARQFKIHGKSGSYNFNDDDDNRSAWTRDPSASANKSKKETKNDSAKKKYQAEKDETYQKLVDEFNKKKKRKEPMLTTHTKEKRKADQSATTGERIPFNRDTDLKAIRLDRPRSSQIAEKARLLSSKFAHGRDQKFL